ncbi:uncharacterized protein LOC116345611 [Contarinia nasturtii]|uniref:uncharacterized protein LOC116345611 n=1 Tax=Contarinia nasturtii TaxID=265458 RepID=UPI0012D4116B|nr:uncharacterized protein LOC116345611 [Contarinia nasturtii]
MRNKVGRRKCEMWISNNKVLIGGGMKKPHARNPNFETEETKLLISLWGDPKVQKTLITTHKKHPVIAKLAESMREHGYHRSPEEINTRIKNLKCFYNRIKKDMEMGVSSEPPSWRHFTAMDEILTRPIFGNRVQQPHLQNLQQKNGDDAEPKDLRPEDLLEVEEEEMDDDDDMDDMDDSIVPKEEPIDIDDMEEIGGDGDNDRNDQEIDDVNDIFPKLSAYLQLASNSALKGATNSNATSKSPLLLDIKTSPPSSPISEPASPKSPTTPSATTSASTTASNLTATTTVSSSATTLGANKISLVPTNILMKPSVSVQSSTAQFSFKPQQFICAKPSGSTGTVLTTTSNGMPMKVLLVNTLQKPNGVTSANTVSVAAKPIISTPLTTRSLVNIQPKPAVVQNSTNNIAQTTYQTRSATAANAQATKTQTLLSSNKYLCSGSSNTAETVTKRQVTFKQKTTPGFRTYLSQLVQIQRERLEIERERLDYERKTGDKILNMITSLLDSKTNTDTKDETKK